jgi:hypothetical protein
MKLRNRLFGDRQQHPASSIDLVHLVYAFGMSEGGFKELERGYKDSVEKHHARRAIDFFPLACMIEDAPNVFVAEKPYVYRPQNDADALVARPLGNARAQFTIAVPGTPYVHTEDSGEQSRLRMDLVLEAFERGEFVLPQAVQLPLARLHIDPYMSAGEWTQ